MDEIICKIMDDPRVTEKHDSERIEVIVSYLAQKYSNDALVEAGVAVVVYLELLGENF